MRTTDDSWDITTSVGATALAVAAARAVETGRDGDDRLVDDPYARAFVDAAAPDLDLPDGDPDDEMWAAQASYLGVRSKFFDDALTAAAAAGVRQVVLLAAGLDVRAHRLDWPSGLTVFEVDQPSVLEFKDRVLGERGASAGAGRVVVPVDLRHDWPAALRAAGFDPSRPTAWLAEGLLPYLPADAEALLFERVQDLSAPGSRIAVEHFVGDLDAMVTSAMFSRLAEKFIGTDVRELFFHDERGEGPIEWFAEHGWDVTSRTAAEQGHAYGRPLTGELLAVMGGVELLAAELRAG